MKDGCKREKEMKSKLCEKVCYRKKNGDKNGAK